MNTTKLKFFCYNKASGILKETELNEEVAFFR